MAIVSIDDPLSGRPNGARFLMPTWCPVGATAKRVCRCGYLIIAALALIGGGCMVGPAYHTPSALPETPPDSYKESPAQFKDETTWKVAQPQDAMLHGKWWEIYRDPELNALEDRLDINNQNIKQYFQNLMAARALIGQARSQLYPTVGTAPEITRTRTPAGAGGSTAGSTPGSTSNYSVLPLDVSWEPDLWGKVRYTINQAVYNAQLSAAELENERLTEQATLAQTLFELRGQDALQKLYNDTIALDKKQVDVTQAQFDTGIGGQIAVVEAQNTLQTAQASATNLAVARAEYEHAIAVLVGQNPSQFSIPVRPSIARPPEIPLGVPSHLLERRPDIAAAERTMAAANAQIGIAYTAYYPDLTLSASAGLENADLGKLLNWSSRFWSIGASLSYTIFDAGLRNATVRQDVAQFNADLASYRQTVLIAFQQVEDYLASVRILSQQADQENLAVQSAQKSFELEQGRYETGIDPYIDLVISQTTLLANQQSLLTIQIQELTSSVQLVMALGGGWDTNQLPTTKAVSALPDAADRQIGR